MATQFSEGVNNLLANSRGTTLYKGSLQELRQSAPSKDIICQCGLVYYNAQPQREGRRNQLHYLLSQSGRGAAFLGQVEDNLHQGEQYIL